MWGSDNLFLFKLALISALNWLASNRSQELMFDCVMLERAFRRLWSLMKSNWMERHIKVEQIYCLYIECFMVKEGYVFSCYTALFQKHFWIVKSNVKIMSISNVFLCLSSFGLASFKDFIIVKYLILWKLLQKEV